MVLFKCLVSKYDPLLLKAELEGGGKSYRKAGGLGVRRLDRKLKPSTIHCQWSERRGGASSKVHLTGQRRRVKKRGFFRDELAHFLGSLFLLLLQGERGKYGDTFEILHNQKSGRR